VCNWGLNVPFWGEIVNFALFCILVGGVVERKNFITRRINGRLLPLIIGFIQRAKEFEMKKNVFFAGTLGMVLLIGTLECNAADWVVNESDIPNKNVEKNYYDSKSVKVHKKTLSWTEKTVLTDFGAKFYTKHLSQYPVCKKNIATKGDAVHHQIDLEIKNGKFRTVAKRNYNKDDKLLCTNKDMGTEFDKSWKEIEYGTAMYERHYLLATKYKVGDI
jgi:hypothetical protein